jgi:hypothetical protein
LFKARELSGLVSGKDMKLKANHVAKLIVYERKERKAFNLLIQGIFDNNS